MNAKQTTKGSLLLKTHSSKHKIFDAYSYSIATVVV